MGPLPRARWFILTLSLLTAAWTLPNPPTPTLTPTPPRTHTSPDLPPLADYEFLSCWGCHEQITDEWARSLHALAWEQPRYQAEIAEKRRPDKCHGCHIPERLQATDLSSKPKPRDAETEAFHYGISCKSCHLADDGAMLGPIEDPQPTEAHESRASRGFSEQGSNALCIACHKTTVGPVIGIARDFETSGGQGRSCIDCHMDTVERSMALGDDDAPAPVRRGRSHRLNGPRDPAFLARAFELEAETRGAGVRVTVENAAGHAVPGLVDRVLSFHFVLETEDGEQVARETLVIDTAHPLPIDGYRRVELAGQGVRVRVEATHEAEALPEPVSFIALELPVQ